MSLIRLFERFSRCRPSPLRQNRSEPERPEVHLRFWASLTSLIFAWRKAIKTLRRHLKSRRIRLIPDQKPWLMNPSWCRLKRLFFKRFQSGCIVLPCRFDNRLHRKPVPIVVQNFSEHCCFSFRYLAVCFTEKRGLNCLRLATADVAAGAASARRIHREMPELARVAGSAVV